MRVSQPCVVIGDIHGQYYDMVHMFERIIDPVFPPKMNLLFLGDYVDRGAWCVEVFMYLVTLKI